MNRDLAFQHATYNKPSFGVFLACTIILLIFILSAAHSVGFVPDYLDDTAPARIPAAPADAPIVRAAAVVATSSKPAHSPEVYTTPSKSSVVPTKIIIPKIGMNLLVQNPESRNLETLDALLQKGPARYVDSAKLGERGNVIIFAHSSNLPVVHNQMFKAFNKVSELKSGDTITLVGDDGMKYLYSVLSVRKADVNDATIDLSPRIGTKLTLVTCDTLTSKSSRFILEADFVGSVAQ
jgi:LPXTG-site transpeptidase (sortase) family protein